MFGEDGFVVHESVLSADELATLRDAVEEVSARLVARASRAGAGPTGQFADGHRVQFSSRDGDPVGVG